MHVVKDVLKIRRNVFLCCFTVEKSGFYYGKSHNYLRIENAEGYVLNAVYLFICMRVTRITQKVLNRIT